MKKIIFTILLLIFASIFFVNAQDNSETKESPFEQNIINTWASINVELKNIEEITFSFLKNQYEIIDNTLETHYENFKQTLEIEKEEIQTQKNELDEQKDNITVEIFVNELYYQLEILMKKLEIQYAKYIKEVSELEEE